jgi:hypothetical protein
VKARLVSWTCPSCGVRAEWKVEPGTFIRNRILHEDDCEFLKSLREKGANQSLTLVRFRPKDSLS